jgi:hypothetical protein
MLASDVFSSVLIVQLSRIRRSMFFLISNYALSDCPAPSLQGMHVFHFGNYYPPVKFSVTEL